jgi:folate-binding protein YgfZ
MNSEAAKPSAKELCRIARDTGLLAAWDRVPGLGAILVAGPDAASFLQSQLTSDVLRLEPGTGHLSARLTRTGALVAHFGVHRLPDRGQPFASFLILLPAAEAPSLLADLKSHLVSEEAVLEEAGQEFQGFVVQGPGADSLLESLSEEGNPAEIVLRQSFTGDPGWVALAPTSGKPSWEEMTSAARHAGFVFLDEHDAADQAWDWLRVEAGFPRAGVDFEPGRTLLPQTGLEQQTVSATKGCYLGQEVVARVRAYGTVPRALRGLIIREPRTLELGSLPPAGHSLQTIDGEKIGTWASSGYSVVWDRPVVLAYLDRDHRTPGLSLQLEAGALELEAEVVLLPLFSAASGTERAATLYDQAVRRFSTGADTEAIDLLQEAIGLDPHLTEAYEALGVVLGRTERFHEAIDVFKRLEELAPDEPMVHTNLSLFYMKIGDKDEAERQKATATMKKFGSRFDQADAAAQLQSEKAARHQDADRRKNMFGEVLAVDPDDGLALMGMGQALLDLEDHVGADRHLSRALGLQPDNSPLYVSRGKVLELLGRSREAAAVYREGVAVASRKGDLMPLKELEHRLFVLAGQS